MTTFEIIAGSSSIISLGISIYALTKVNQIKNKMINRNKIDNVTMKAKGDKSQQAIGNITNNN